MPIIRVGVQAVSTSAGQGVDFDGGPIASSLSFTNVSGESVAYTTSGGLSWATVTAGASVSLGRVEQSAFRLRKVSNGGYPAPVDVNVEASDGLSAAEVAATQALVSGAGSLASPMLIAKTNATFSRVSANTAADNTFGTLYSFLLPGGSMGPNGTLRWEAELGFTDPATNAGTTVGFQLRIGAVGICPEVGGSFAGGQLFANQSLEWHNTAVAAQKYRGSYAKQGGSSAGFLTTTIDTAVDQTVDFAARWSGATPSETLSLLSLRVWVEYGA